MLENKKSKILITFLLIISLVSTFSFAVNETEEAATTNEVTNETTVEESTTEEPAATEEPATAEESATSEEPTTNNEVYQGDLYLTGADVTMDRIVNGNVYILANKAKITGQVSGNLFICANEVEFEDAYIESSIFAVANKMNFKAVASDLYAAVRDLTIPTNYGVYRDLRVTADKATLLGIIGRDAYVTVNDLSIKNEDSIVTIYGDLNYESSKEVEVPDGAVTGSVNFNKIVDDKGKEEKKSSVKEYVIGAIGAIVISLLIYGVLSVVSKKSLDKYEEIVSKKFLPAFLTGLVGYIVASVVAIVLLLLGGIIGVKPFVFEVLSFILICIMSIPVVNIVLSKILASKFNMEGKALRLVVLAVVALVVYLIGLIPFLGFVVELIISTIGFGTVLLGICSKEKKENK